MPELLLASNYPTVPLRDATDALRDPERLRALAASDGYLFLPGLLPRAAVALVRAFVRRRADALGWIAREAGDPPVWTATPGARLDGRGWDDPRWIALQREVSTHPAFRALAEDTHLMDVLATLLGEPAALATANHCWLKLPGSPEHTTRPHRDAFYLPTCPRMWTVWMPLTETPSDVGPLGVVPGSHRSGEWPQRDAMAGIDVPRHVTWATGDVHPCDVVAFGAETIHCAWANTSPTQVRVSLDVRYEPRAIEGSILRAG